MKYEYDTIQFSDLDEAASNGWRFVNFIPVSSAVVLVERELHETDLIDEQDEHEEFEWREMMKRMSELWDEIPITTRSKTMRLRPSLNKGVIVHLDEDETKYLTGLSILGRKK